MTDDEFKKLMTDWGIAPIPGQAYEANVLGFAKAVEATEREKWRTALEDTTDFMERHSNRWDGENGKHPAEVVEAARTLLRSNVEVSGLRGFSRRSARLPGSASF